MFKYNKCNELLRGRLWQSHLLFTKRTSCGDVYSMRGRSIFASSCCSESPSRIFLFFLVTFVCGRSIFHLAPVYHSKRSYLPETRRPTSAGAGESCDIGLSRSDLYYRTVLPPILRFGVITLDFKRFNSICRINLEERLKVRGNTVY